MTGLIERLREIVQPQVYGAMMRFSKKTGLSYSRVAGWFYRQKLNSLPQKDLSIICKTHGINSVWLLTGEGNKFALPPRAVLLSDNPSPTRRIPIVSKVQAGKSGFWLPFFDPAFSLEGLETVETTSRDIGAYAMEVEGESMAPLLFPGDIIIVSPNQEVRNKDIVVLLSKGDELMVKLWRLSGDIVLLKSYSLGVNDITLHLRDIVFYQKVVAIKKR